MPTKKTTQPKTPALPKKYELINKRPAPIAINCIQAVLHVPGTVSGRVIVTEEQLESQDIQFLLGRNWIEAVEYRQQKQPLKAKSKATSAPQSPAPAQTQPPEQDGSINNQKGSEVTIRYAGQTLTRHMSQDATLQGLPQENIPDAGPRIIDTDADQKFD